jgi:alkylation response protein AidB-like acyl-CoA dehydrogenase
MELELAEGHEQVRARTREFAATSLLPDVRDRERQHLIPPAIMRAVAAQGLIGVNVAKEWGGAALGVVAYATAVRELAYVDPAVAVTMAVTNMVSEVIVAFGTDAQKQRYLPKLTSGEFYAGAFALSETGAGSDAGALTTRAIRSGDSWVISGEKMWISHGDMSDVLVVWARTGGPGTAGISCFLVDKGTPGLAAGKAEEKMGLRASHTVSLSFDGVTVPASRLLGRENEGFRIAMVALDGGRIGVAAQALGIGFRALDKARAYVTEFVAFVGPEQTGVVRGADQATQFQLADMKTELEAAWLMVLRAAWLKENKQPFSRQAAMAKAFATEAANRAVRRAVEICGGHGVVEDLEVARLMRDCRVTQIYEGTSEVQRLVIARDVLKSGVLP